MNCQGDCKQGRSLCVTPEACALAKPRRTCAELGVCQNRTPACDESCLPILHGHNSDGSDPHAETRDLVELALDGLLSLALIVLVVFIIFAAIGYWSTP